MDKQKKLVIQVVIPVGIVVLVLIFFLFTRFVFSEKKVHKSSLTTEIPDVPQKIEENKIQAYSNQKIYEGKTDKAIISDFSLKNPPDKTPQENNAVPSPSPSPKKKIKSGKFKERMAKASKDTEYEYRELMSSENEGNVQKHIKEVKSEVQAKIIPQPLVFNSQTNRQAGTINVDNQVLGYIHGQQTVINRSLVKLRTGSDFTYKSVRIPKNTILYGMCSFQNNRLQITVRTILYGNCSIPCEIRVCDLNGYVGLNVKEMPGFDSGKKTASASSRRIGSTVGTALKAVTGTGIAGELAGIAAEGTAKAISSSVSDNIKLNDITLTNDYRLILKLN